MRHHDLAQKIAPPRTQVLLSWSGGKDSALTLAALRDDPTVDVVALLTTVTEGYDRISIHGVRRALLYEQARSVGLPLREIVLQPQSSNEAYDVAVGRALASARGEFPEATHVAYGDLFLDDVRQYREARMSALGYTCLFPIWGRSTDALAREFVDRGFVAHLVCVDTTQLDARFAGRRYDHTLLDELPPSVDPCGERGEFHTFVSAGPGLTAQVAHEIGDVVLRDARFAYCDLVPAAG